MPGEIGRRSIFRLPVYLPEPAWHGDPSFAYDGQGFWLATKRLSKGRFEWWPTGTEAARTLRAHQAQLLLAAGNPDAEAPPAWRPLNAEKELPNIQKHLRSVFDSATLTADATEWRYRGRVITADRYRFHSPVASPRIRRPAGADFPRSCARHGSGNRPTALCAIWFAAACCSCCTGPARSNYRPSASKPSTRSSGVHAPAPMLIDTTPIAGTLKELRPDRVQAGAANGRRAAVQQPDGAASLPRL